MKPIGNLLEGIMTPTNDRNPEDTIIKEFVSCINAERAERNWRYKKGERWVKEKPIEFMAVKMKLYTIRKSDVDLRTFLTECKLYAATIGSKGFSYKFFGATKVKK